MSDYKQIFSSMLEDLKKKNSIDIANVVKAFHFAEEKHSGQFRKDGTPYIIHPVEVAKILEERDFNTDVICGALLHDTVEDCNVTIDELKSTFNHQIAQIVDAVTAIRKENFLPDSNNIFTDTKDFLKQAVEDSTYQKLISIGKNNKFGFYIKFADRLNNLSTIACFPKYKKEAKILETEKWLIPLAKLLKSRYFYYKLTNGCFCVRHEDDKLFFEYLDKYINNMSSYTEQLKNSLTYEINSYLRSTKHTLNKIEIIPKTPYEVYTAISRHFITNKLSSVKESNFISVPIFDIYIILNEDLTDNLKNLYTLLSEFALKDEFKIIGVDKDDLENLSLKIIDKMHNLFDISMLSIKQYNELQNGTTDGTDIDALDETIAGGVDADYITVYTPKNKAIKVPAKSTVLDFAFKLHQDIGFSVLYAYINDSPNKSPIYTRLHNGDKVEVVCKLDSFNMNQNIAELRWLAYCKNESTLRTLIKYFERKYT